MKLVRNTTPDGLCKYALVRLDKLGANPPRSADEAQAMNDAFALMERAGIIEYGRVGKEDEFFAGKLKDRHMRPALLAYADSIEATDPEFAAEVRGLAERAGERNPFCKEPDTAPGAHGVPGTHNDQPEQPK